MSDYRRFVSYVYLYENGIKTVNAGFVRVESRGNQCRINISMKNMHQSGSNCEAYAFVRKGKELLGIPIGTVNVKNHLGEMQCVTETRHIGNTEYGLDSIAGIIVVGENGRIYGTGWDDELIDILSFRTNWQENSTENPEDEALMDELGVLIYDGKEDLSMEIAAMPEADVMIAQHDDSETEIETEIEKAEIEKEPEEDLEQTKESEKEPEEMVAEKEADSPQQQMSMWLREQLETLEADKKQVHIHNIAKQAQKRRQAEEMHFQEYTIKNEDFRRKNIENVFNKCPKMSPFDKQGQLDCVKMDIQDIGMLPMDCWAFGSNSFVLQGYYSYRYLILVREHYPKESQAMFYLGIPGLYTGQTQFIASMFGFAKFQAVGWRKNGEIEGDFGYWCHLL